MRRSLVALGVSAALVGVGAPPAAAATPLRASGSFTVSVTGAPSLRPLPGDHCSLTAPLRLSFVPGGTLVGDGSGTIRVAIDAPCAAAATDPPGTHADAFAFSGAFTGTVAGKPASATLVYTGATQPGGAVRGVIALTGTRSGFLAVRAAAGAGGTYSGSVS
jgi:hypothetical protein